jgi:hypothetical protein
MSYNCFATCPWLLLFIREWEKLMWKLNSSVQILTEGGLYTDVSVLYDWINFCLKLISSHYCLKNDDCIFYYIFCELISYPDWLPL